MDKRLALAFLFYSFLSFGADDLLILSSGKEFKGKIIDDSPKAVVFETAPGKRYRVQREKIRSLVKARPPRTPASIDDLKTPAPQEAPASVTGSSDIYHLNLSAGLAMSEGSYGGAFLAGADVAVASRRSLRLGLTSGILLSSYKWLPILLTATQYFEGSNNLHPYLGLLVGPVILLSGASSTVIGAGGVTVTVPTTYSNSVLIAIVARPGVAFNLSESIDFNFEIPFGALTGILYVAPSVGLAVRL